MSKPVQASLRRQLLLHLAAPLLLVLGLGAGGGMLISGQIGYMVHDQWLLDSAMTLAAQVQTQDARVVLRLPPAAIQMFEWDRIDHIYWQASSAQQGFLLGNASIPAAPAPLQRDQPQFYDAQIGTLPVRVVALEQRAPAGVQDVVRIVVAETMQKRDVIATKSFFQWAPLQVLMFGLAGLFIWLAVSRNLAKVDAIAARLSKYQPDSHMPVIGLQDLPTEILPLISAINGLIIRLGAEQQTQKRFISNAAHQLRTPLASLQVQAQRALRERDVVLHEQAMEDVSKAVTRLHHVTQQLLMLMRSEQATEQHLKFGTLDLAELTRHEVEHWTDTALGRHIDLGYNGTEQALMIDGDAFLLREMIGNLLDNAIKYSREGGTVTLTLEQHPLCITVEDDGPGIADDERTLVLERFYRGSNNELVVGCGLGLPIASEIAARHAAKLRILGGAHGIGTRVCIVFSASTGTMLHSG